MNVAQNIIRLRKGKGWTQRELAKKLDQNAPQINRIETGKYLPTLDLAVKMAELFGVPLDQLVSGNGEIAEVKIEDRNLSDRINLLNSLNEDERGVIIKVIDAILTKKKMAELIQNGVAAAS